LFKEKDSEDIFRSRKLPQLRFLFVL